MTIKEIHDFILLVLDKEVSGWNTPEEIDQALDRSSMSIFRTMLKGYAMNQEYQDALSPFKTPHVFTNTSSSAGVITLPDNYVHLLSISAMVFDNEQETNRQIPVEIVNADELAERLGSQLKKVTSNKPIAHFIGKGKLQLFPSKEAVGQVWYLRRPNKPKYNYTQTGRAVTYTEQGSIQLEWGEVETNAVIYQALQLLGVNLSDEQMVQYTQLKLAEA